MSAFAERPFYIKAPLILLGLYIFLHMLHLAQGIILPLLYALLISIAISPLVNFLMRKGLNRMLSIVMVLLLAMLISAGFITLFISQASLLSEAWPVLIHKLETLIRQAVMWASAYFNISVEQINAWVADQRVQLLQNGTRTITTTLTGMGSIVAGAVLTPVYTFMLLYYQPHLTQFTYKLAGTLHGQKVGDMLLQTKTIVQSYLAGLFAETLIIAVLNSIGLLLLGIPYAILLGVIGAMLNIIPYLGGLIAVTLYLMVTVVTQEPVYVLYVFLLHTVIQLIDNHYIIPRIVGARVKLNALICILAVISTAALWGVPGMFLSIPLTAIIKVVFDRIDSLKSWGFLMGDTINPLSANTKLNSTTKGFSKHRLLKTIK